MVGQTDTWTVWPREMVVTFKKYSADLIKIIQEPEVLAWDLYSRDIITVDQREATCHHMHFKSMRTSSMLSAIESKIAVDPEKFYVFLSVLAEYSPLRDLCERMKGVFSY